MIDIANEQIVTLAQLVRKLPPRRNQRPVHPATAHRWRYPGLLGVRLEAIRIGGVWCTSLEAFQRFCEELSAKVVPGRNQGGEAESSQRSRERLRQERVERALDDLGL